MIAGVVVPSILALLPFSMISFPTLIGLSVLAQIGALIIGIHSWQRTQGKITACAAATLLFLIGMLIILMIYTHDHAFESMPE